MFVSSEGKKMSLFDVQLVIQIEKGNDRTEPPHGPGDPRHTEPGGAHSHPGGVIA